MLVPRVCQNTLQNPATRVKMLSHSMNARKYVCYDTGSGVTATTLIQDVTHIDTSRAALRGYEVEGIGLSLIHI